MKTLGHCVVGEEREKPLVDGERGAADSDETVVGGVVAAHSGLLAVVLKSASDGGDLMERKSMSGSDHLNRGFEGAHLDAANSDRAVKVVQGGEAGDDRLGAGVVGRV